MRKSEATEYACVASVVSGVTVGVWILLAAVAVAVAVGVLVWRRDGHFRQVRSDAATAPERGEPGAAGQLLPSDIDAADWGERATLVHFSTAFCAPCRATRQVLAQVSEVVPGVELAEVDAESHLDLVRRLDIRRTPTVLVVDAEGRIRTRASGQPRKADVLAALGQLTPDEVS